MIHRTCDECKEVCEMPPSGTLFRADSDKTDRTYVLAYGFRVANEADLPDLCDKCVRTLLALALAEGKDDYLTKHMEEPF